MVNENRVIDIEKLAQSIASDISKLDKVVPTRINLKDRKGVDFSVLSRGSTAETLKRASHLVRARGDAVSKKHRASINEVSGKMENTLRKRQTRLASGLRALSKTALKKDVEAKIILNRVSDGVNLGKRRLDELHMEKTMKTDVRLPRKDISRLIDENKRSPG